MPSNTKNMKSIILCIILQKNHVLIISLTNNENVVYIVIMNPPNLIT